MGAWGIGAEWDSAPPSFKAHIAVKPLIDQQPFQRRTN